MDSIIVVEECNKRNESLALASKSLASASLVQINSIAIDINCAAEEIDQSPKHEHFSIRGFVSEMRKRDRKKCNPFASEGESNNSGMDLPPLSVPKFRWWQCPNCVPEFGDHESNLGMILADKSVIAEGNCCENVNSGEKQGLLTHSIQTGNEETNYTSDKIIAYNNSWCTDGYKAAADIRTTEAGPSWTDVPEANQIQLIEAPAKSSDASDKVCSAGKASSGSDNTIAYSALPHKRKPKLRSLADIINEERNFAFEHPRTKSLSSSSQTEDDSNLQPRLDVSLDAAAAKSTKTPLRKRKNIVHEDDGPPETSSPTFMAKKSKGSILEPENNIKSYKRVEISESDSENVRTAGKALPSKSRKQKAIDMNRKSRRTIIENRTAVQMMSNSSLHCANLGNNFGNIGELGPIFKKSVSGHEKMDVFSDLSKGKRPEGHCTVLEKVVLDLSLSSYMGAEMNSKNQESSGKCTGIPDLNESFVDKTNVMEGQQVPDFIETRSFAVHEYLDISAPSNNEPAQNIYYNNNTVIERGPSSDDIPMEIVELLAKNQHDKAHDNSRKHLGPEGINNNSFKQAHYVENNRGPFNFPFRTGPNVASGKMGLGQEFLNPDKAQFRHLSPLTAAHQRIPLYPGPNPLSRPKPREGVDLLWPPRRKNVTFDLTGLDDQSYRGKSVGYLSVDQGKKAANDESLVKEGKIGLTGCRPVGPIDAYSNETIPAMQLLSLMDQGAVSGSSFKVGPNNNFLDRQFSPCNHHPRLNKNDSPNEKFVGSSSFFVKSNHINDFPTLLNGARFSGESSKKSFSQVQILPPQKGYSKAVDQLADPSNLARASRSDDLKLEICTLNRNPADFSIPDSKNVFMISAKDLKPKKRISSKDRARPVNFDGPKKPKMRKNSSVKKARENNSREG
ncbi:protein EMBRYONIC FLOWER 1 [Striga asiatica]|uniref:Protein EMBRYONIC FLOWER 1 n=1 Tax=Striga asiatica TaxID=4170 RepID=A0A5A7PI30_STRAF|nr:protein EMBRYONIC FLOWER 1 [Striga asiatica]